MLVPDRFGKLDDVVLGYDTVEEYLADTYNFGALVSRNANRIGGASLELGGVCYQLAVNSGGGQSAQRSRPLRVEKMAG